MSDIPLLQAVNEEKGTSMPLKGTPSYTEIITYAENCFGRDKDARLQFERQWYLNLAFYFGKQYVNWTTETASAKLMTPGGPKWRVRLVSNQVRRYVRKEHAKAVKENPVGYVLPASGDEEDLMAAKAGDAIYEYLIREMRIRNITRKAIFWANMTGNGFLKDWYNKKKPDEDTLGDMPGLECVTPFHIFVPDVVQESIEDQERVTHGALKSRFWVKNTYDIDVSTQGRTSSGMEEDKFLQAMGVVDRNAGDSVYVKEMWCKPGGKYKDGAVIVWCDSDLLYFQEGWPLPYSDYPFTKIDHIPTGKFYNESIITDLIPLQKEYNKSRSQIIEAKNKMAKPQLKAPLGSIDASKYTSEPGLIVWYKPGFDSPEPIQMQNLPQYAIDELDRNKSDMDDISSQHEVSRGQVPPGIEAATAISYLQEQDDSVLNELTHSIEEAAEKVGRHLLHHVNQNWTMERKIQVTGLNNQLEAFMFSKSNLNGNTDFRVEQGSATPRSQAGKQAMIRDLMRDGVIDNVKGLKYLSMGDSARIYEEMQIDVRQAQRENLKMQMGMGYPQPQQKMGLFGPEEVPAPTPQELMSDPSFTGFPVNSWDDDLVHIEEHDNWRKRQEYESATPEVKFLFELHDRSHKRRLAVNLGIPIPPEVINNPGHEALFLNQIYFKIKNGIPLAPPVEGGASSEQEGAPQE